jgi:hypothetical protein
VRAVLITGPPGSGKTSVLTALVDALSDDDVPHAALEVEAVVWTHPALADDARLRHVRVNCALLRKAGAELLLVGDTIESEAELCALREAVDADECFVGCAPSPTRWPSASSPVSRRTGPDSPSWSSTRGRWARSAGPTWSSAPTG